MPPVHFKLTKSDGHTRRVTLQELPTWTQLASKLQALYGIPIDNVGVSYIDNDNDEITASSNEELQDFYQTSYEQGQLIKFNVLDLTVSRETAPSQSSNPSRNTFGQENFDFPDSDWQRLGAFSVADFLDSASEGPHAFVEVVNSDITSLAKDHESDSEDGQSTIQPTIIDKGKVKASSLGAASVISVVDEEPSEKFPVHVLDHASTNKHHSTEPLESIPADSHPYIAAQSTPKAQAENLKTQETTDSEPNNVEDPPLPSFDTPQSNASAALSRDLATFLNTLHSVVSSHPELSESVRNIVRNSTNGTYWQAHRSFLSQAAEGMRQPAEGFEEDAAHRVSEALGTFFRSMSLFTMNDEQNPSRESTTSTHELRGPNWPQFPFSSRRPWYRRYTSMYDASMNHQQWVPHWHGPSWPFEQSPSGSPPPSGAPPPPAVPPPPPATQLPFVPPRFPSNDAPIPPPPPPPPGPAPYNIPAPIPPLHDSAQQPTLPPIPPVPFSSRLGPHHGHHGYRFRNGYPPHLHNHYQRPPPPPPVEGTTTAANPPVEERGGLPDQAPNTQDVPSQDATTRLTAQQLRSQVEEAKRAYKAQKEIYRREREERRKAKASRDIAHDIDNSVASTRAAGNGGPSQIVSNAWGSYPQLEIYSAGAPRRHNTHPGHDSKRGEGKSEDLNTRARSRIAKRLADMGFSEHSHRNLSGKIKAQMPANKIISKEQEDDIVTTLLEEFLAQSAKSPIASGSGSKATVIPGEWDL